MSKYFFVFCSTTLHICSVAKQAYSVWITLMFSIVKDRSSELKDNTNTMMVNIMHLLCDFTLYCINIVIFSLE